MYKNIIFILHLRVSPEGRFPALIKVICGMVGHDACDLILKLQQFGHFLVHEFSCKSPAIQLTWYCELCLSVASL